MTNARHVAPALLAALALVAPVPALADAASCSASSTTLAFGLYNPLDPLPLDNNAGSVSVGCSTGSGATAGVPVTLALGPGHGTVAQRLLRNGASSLRYNVYTGPGRTTVWGDGSAGSATQSATVAATGAGRTTSWVLYGRIPARQFDAVPGVFTDTLTVTVSW